MVAEVFEYPLDLAKVRLQSQVLDSAARFGGPLDCLMQTWRDEGIRGLYRVSSSLLRYLLGLIRSGTACPHIRFHGRDGWSFCHLQPTPVAHHVVHIRCLEGTVSPTYSPRTRSCSCRIWIYDQFYYVRCWFLSSGVSGD